MTVAESHGAAGGRSTLHERKPSASASSDATSEQVELVTRIRRTKDYYEILQVSKSASDDEIKKAYRKLSLKVHPDKNKARGADEAFKLVSRAFQCLSDTDLRANYDRYGHEDPQVIARQRQQQQAQRGYQRMYVEDGFDPNDVFNAFFFGGGLNPNAHMYRADFGAGGFRFQRQNGHQRAAPQQNGQARQGNLMGLLQLLPLFLLFVFTLLPSRERLFQLERSDNFSAELTTSKASIPYYVKSAAAFEKEYPEETRARERVEYEVEREWREYCETRCYHERMQRDQAFQWGQAKRAEGMTTPHCDELRRLARIARAA